MAQKREDFKILFIGKQDNAYACQAAAFLQVNFSSATIFLGNKAAPLPAEVLNWQGDLLISFVSSWVLPAELLKNVSFAAINFHPGSPAYPGTGCTNFAVYNNEKKYGTTCHHMAEKVDAGDIISVKWFDIGEADTVFSITQKCHQLILEQFYEIMKHVQSNTPLPATEEKWQRKPYTRKELNALCEITFGMSEAEIERRIKATSYEGRWAFVKLGNRIFKLQD